MADITAEMVRKLRTEIATREDRDIVIMARIDAHGVEGYDGVMRRADLYLKAGDEEPAHEERGKKVSDPFRRVLEKARFQISREEPSAPRPKALRLSISTAVLMPAAKPRARPISTKAATSVLSINTKKNMPIAFTRLSTAS